MHCERPNDNSRVWKAPDGLHIDLRGLEPPEPMVAVLQLIDRGDVETALIAHFDREPIFLYPELDDRGWSHEIIPHDCGNGTDDIKIHIVRYGA